MLDRLHPRRRGIKRWREHRHAGGFNPAQLSPVTAWLRTNATSGAVASIADVINVNPATQGTALNQPTGTTLNGLPATSFDGSEDYLSWPIITATNGAVTFGFASWIKFGSVAATRRIFCCNSTNSGATAARLEFIRANDILLGDVYTNLFVSRRGQTAAGAAQATTAVFLSFEFDGGQALEADKFTIWINNVKQALTFSDSSGTPPGSTMPATLIQPTGSIALGGITTASSLNSIWGRNQYTLGGAGGIAGGGLLTSAQRLALMNFEPGG